jgi:hypothetical protein
MTFQQFILAVQEIPAPPDWRRGQTLFNGLLIAREDIAKRLNGTDADPFNDDTRIGAFWAFVEAHWNDKEDE